MHVELNCLKRPSDTMVTKDHGTAFHDAGTLKYVHFKVRGRYVDLYSALDDKYLVLKALQTWITQFNLQTTPCLPLAFVRVHQVAPTLKG